MATKSLTDRTFGGLLWVFSGTATQALLSMIVMIVLARLLTPTEFGVVGAALVVVGFSQIFSHLGIGPAIVQCNDLTPEHVRAGFTVSVGMGVLVGVVIFASAPLLSLFFHIDSLTQVVQVLALVFPITGLSVAGQALLQREMQFKRLSVIGLLSYAFGYGLVGICLAMVGFGVWALVVAHLGQSVLYASITLFMKRQAIGFSLNRKEIAHLLNFGTGFSLAKIANYSALQADNLVVGRWLGAEALGVYGRAYQFLVIPANLLGTAVDKVIFPAMASVQHERDRLGRAYTRSVATVAMFSLPLSGMLVVIAPEIIQILLGGQWADVILPFQVLATVLCFRTGYKISDSLARATGAVYRRAWRQCIYAVAVFTCAWLGHFWGLLGVAVGVSVAIVVNFLLMFHLSARLVACTWWELWKIHLRYGALGGLVGVTVWICKSVAVSFALHPVLIVGGGGLTAVMTIFFVFLATPSFFGEEGVWLGSLCKRHWQAAAGRP